MKRAQFTTYNLVTDPSGKKRYESIYLDWCTNFMQDYYHRTKVLCAIKTGLPVKRGS